MARLKNIKHEKFCKALISTAGNQSLAYQKVYGCKNSTARTNSSMLLDNVNIRERVYSLLMGNSNTKINKLINKLGSLTNANKQIAVNNLLCSVADNPTQLESIKTLLKLYGLLGNNGNGTTINETKAVTFNINSGEQDKLNSIIGKLQNLNADMLNNTSSLAAPKL